MSDIKALKAQIAKNNKALAALTKANEVLLKQISHQADVDSGDKPSPAQAKLIASQGFSYSVHFLRARNLTQVASPGLVMKSTRRFGTRKEAEQHGKRFASKHKHRDYSVVLVNRRPNAWINWKTGKTNPVIT